MPMTMKREIHWNLTANATPESRILDTREEADVIVVGAGLTGCRTALGLAEAGRSVVLLDANRVGWGASGRSGGQCNPMWRQTPEQLSQRFGKARAQLLVRTTLSAAEDLFSDIRRHDIDCDPVQAGWVQAAHTRASRQSLQALRQGWNEAGAQIDVLEGADVERISGSPAYRFALFHPVGGHVHPLSLTQGYARAAQRFGARLFCGEPVQSLEREGEAWRLSTASGSISAEQVVFCTNAYTAPQPLAGLDRTFMPMVSVILATEPLSAAQRATVLPDSVTLSDSRLAIYFCRYDRDGRLLFGCVGSSEQVSAGAEKRLRRGLNTVFPQLMGIGIERVWGGRIAVTPGMMPQIHQPAPGVTAALGYSGRGIAMTSVMGRALAAHLLGEPESILPFPVVPMKPMPMHTVLKSLQPLSPPMMSLKDGLDSRIGAIREETGTSA